MFSSRKIGKSVIAAGAAASLRLLPLLLLLPHPILSTQPARFLAKTASSAPQASPAAQPDSPLQIVSTSPAAPTVSAKMNEYLSQRGAVLVGYQVSLRDTSAQDVVAYALRWLWQDPSGKTVGTKGTCSSRFSFSPAKPVIHAGELGQASAKLIQRGPTVRVLVDFVLLADGSMYGDNECGALQTFQDNVTARLSTEKWILSVLESQGAEPAKQLLRGDLANESWYQTLLNPKAMQ